MAKVFSMQQKVLFKHCDPAGIVFFPRYFEMMNDCVEAFFDEALGVPFEKLLVTHGGVPTAQIQTSFCAPSRHGDHLTLTLTTKSIGRTSWSYAMEARCGEQTRFTTEATLVHIDAAGKPCRWPDELRQTISDYEAP